MADVAPVPGDVRELVRATAIEAIGFDRRIVATVRDLLVRPARVIRAHLDGRAHSYVHPLKLFFFLGGLYVLGVSWLQPFSFSREKLTESGVSPSQATALNEMITREGLTVREFDAKFQDRMSTISPLTTALALLPGALLLALVARGRRLRDHLTFLLVISNAIWLVSLLILPLAVANNAAHGAALIVMTNVYLGIGFFAVYPSRSRARTSARFAVFAAADLIMSFIVGMLLLVAVFLSVIYI